MRIIMLVEKREKLTPRQTRVWRVGETVTVDDARAREWIAEGAAKPATADGAEVELTADETAVLKLAAQQIVQQQREALAALEFDKMTVADLQAVAAELKLDVSSHKKKADIVAALEAKRAEVLGIADLTREPI